MSYEQEFEIFRNNVNTAARAYYYNVHMNKAARDNEKLLTSINEAARFWLDYRYYCTLSVVITLGRVFDTPRRAHKIETLLKSARGIDVFSKESLKQRKKQGSSNWQEWLEDYMYDVYVPTEEDWKNIEKYIEETRILWQNISNVRHKILAHEEKMDEAAKLEILQNADGGKFEDIISRLLTLENIFWQLYHNGEKPDFEWKNQQVSQNAKKEVDRVLLSVQ